MSRHTIDGLITPKDLDAFSTALTANIGGTLWKHDEIVQFLRSIDLGMKYRTCVTLHSDK